MEKALPMVPVDPLMVASDAGSRSTIVTVWAGPMLRMVVSLFGAIVAASPEATRCCNSVTPLSTITGTPWTMANAGYAASTGVPVLSTSMSRIRHTASPSGRSTTACATTEAWPLTGEGPAGPNACATIVASPASATISAAAMANNRFDDVPSLVMVCGPPMILVKSNDT